MFQPNGDGHFSTKKKAGVLIAGAILLIGSVSITAANANEVSVRCPDYYVPPGKLFYVGGESGKKRDCSGTETGQVGKEVGGSDGASKPLAPVVDAPPIQNAASSRPIVDNSSNDVQDRRLATEAATQAAVNETAWKDRQYQDCKARNERRENDPSSTRDPVQQRPTYDYTTGKAIDVPLPEFAPLTPGYELCTMDRYADTPGG